MLKAHSFQHYVENFNRNDNELYHGYVPNSTAWNFLKVNMSLLDCPDKEIAAAEKRDDWCLMFYIGFRDEPHAQIGIARSRDGLTNWQRHPANPIIRPGQNKWDHDACYKPYAIFDGQTWLLWYNGRHDSLEQIGVAVHRGEDLGFPELK